MQFAATRVELVEHGHVLWNDGRPWQVLDDYCVVVGDVTYTTEEGYQDTLRTLAFMNVVGSRYLQ